MHGQEVGEWIQKGFFCVCEEKNGSDTRILTGQRPLSFQPRRKCATVCTAPQCLLSVHFAIPPFIPLVNGARSRAPHTYITAAIYVLGTRSLRSLLQVWGLVLRSRQQCWSTRRLFFFALFTVSYAACKSIPTLLNEALFRVALYCCVCTQFTFFFANANNNNNNTVQDRLA